MDDYLISIITSTAIVSMFATSDKVSFLIVRTTQQLKKLFKREKKCFTSFQSHKNANTHAKSSAENKPIGNLANTKQA